MTTSRAQAFAAALQDLESSGDPGALTPHFAAGAELIRPETRRNAGPQPPEEFWTRYLEPFEQVATEFEFVAESEDLAVLEWESDGVLVGGSPIHYHGVSVLVFDGDLVSRFSTFYDTAAFLHAE